MTKLILFLIFSMILNIFLFLYLRWVLKKLVFISDNILALFESTEAFSAHLKTIYEMEMFYGDETLKSLLTHSKQLVEEIKIYEEIYTLVSEDQIEEELFYDPAEEAEEES